MTMTNEQIEQEIRRLRAQIENMAFAKAGMQVDPGLITLGQNVKIGGSLTVGNTTYPPGGNADTVDFVHASQIVSGINDSKVGQSNDFNELHPSGFYEGTSMANAPNADAWHHYLVARHSNIAAPSQYELQIASGFWTDELYFRLIKAAVPGVWMRLWHGGLLPWTDSTTWTPVLTSTGATFSYARQIGRYWRWGNFVCVEFSIQLSAAPTGTLTNSLIITLPYGHANIGNLYTPVPVNWGSVTLGANYYAVQGFLTPGSQNLVFNKVGTGNASTYLLANTLTIYSELYGVACYLIA